MRLRHPGNENGLRLSSVFSLLYDFHSINIFYFERVLEAATTLIDSNTCFGIRPYIPQIMTIYWASPLSGWISLVLTCYVGFVRTGRIDASWLDWEEYQISRWILWWLAQRGGELLITADICSGGQAACGHSAKASASFWHKCQNDKISAYVICNLSPLD